MVDGPSTDATAEIARANPHVRYMRQTGKGMWNALNEGIAAAQGELLAFLSHDDLWHPDKLRLQVEAFRAHPEADCVTAHIRFVQIKGEPLPRAFKPELLQGEHVAYLIEVAMMRREVFERVGLFAEHHLTSADVDWFARARDLPIRFEILPEVLLFKGVHAENMNSHPNSATMLNHELTTILHDKILRRRQRISDSVATNKRMGEA